jgi:hypothetical protein
MDKSDWMEVALGRGDAIDRLRGELSTANRRIRELEYEVGILSRTKDFAENEREDRIVYVCGCPAKEYNGIRGFHPSTNHRSSCPRCNQPIQAINLDRLLRVQAEVERLRAECDILSRARGLAEDEVERLNEERHAMAAVVEESRACVVAHSDIVDQHLFAMYGAIEKLDATRARLGICPECGDGADGCYCAEDAEPKEASDE